MADDLRSQVMTPGHCTFCGEPAERGLSGAWWHLDQSCNVALAVVPAGAIPAGPLGWAAQWPPRFKPGPYDGPRPTDQPEETRTTNRTQVEQLHDTLTHWLETKER